MLAADRQGAGVSSASCTQSGGGPRAWGGHRRVLPRQGVWGLPRLPRTHCQSPRSSPPHNTPPRGLEGEPAEGKEGEWGVGGLVR